MTLTLKLTNAPECLEIRVERPGAPLELQPGEDELVDGTSGLVDQVHQLPVVRPGLQPPREEPERRICSMKREVARLNPINSHYHY